MSTGSVRGHSASAAALAGVLRAVVTCAGTLLVLAGRAVAEPEQVNTEQVNTEQVTTEQVTAGQVTAGQASTGNGEAPLPASIDYSRDIRPILSNTCFKCHGPDDQVREADLRLDTAAGAQADLGGHQAITPGNPETSELIARIRSTDDERKMPPADSGLKLSEREVALLTLWIRQGADYEQHWAFRPIVRPQEPAVQSAWPRNAIDRFVLARLSEAGISPAPEASRSTLIRRVSLDLLGLPPTVEDVDRFLNDTSENAFEQMVDRTLMNPHYGERWGRHWLDQARYADTNGYTIDSERSLWPFRDWVINALNNDMPFDQFTVEQIAGDLLPQPSQEQRVATGFHRNTLVNEEGGTDDEQFRNEAVVDRVNTTGAVWLGLTVGCAQCHTHKYDPVTQHEYYRLFAFFNSGRDVNTVDPTIPVPTHEQAVQLAELERQIADAEAAVAAYEKTRREAADSGSAPPQQDAVNWTVVAVDQATATGGAVFRTLEDGSQLVVSESMPTEQYTISFPTPLTRITGLRLEALTHPTLPKTGPGRSDTGNFVLNEIQLEVTGADPAAAPAKWIYSVADHSQKGYPVADAADGKPETGWSINVESGSLNVSRTAVFVTSELPVTPTGRVTVRLQFHPVPPMINVPHNLGHFRLAVTDASHTQLNVPDEQKTALLAVQKNLEDARKKLTAGIARTLVMADLEKPRETNVLLRGDFLRKGDVVTPDVPAVFPPLAPSQPVPTSEPAAPSEPAEQSEPAAATGTLPVLRTRLDLARWLVDPANPLTARVTVNRIWARYFGLGLVETENDFGLQGTPPTHPELLNWLSAEFMERGWSLKHLHRLIVSSATYRQQSHHRPELSTTDPLNRLLARQSRLRVDAEVVRDLGLAVSGLLHPRIGGPGVYPPQPDGVFAFTQRSLTWPVSTGPDRYRRGMYTFYMRSAPYPMLTTFDTPRFNTTCTMRVRSNTPLQSLAMANDETMLEMARALGRRIQNESDRTASDSETRSEPQSEPDSQNPADLDERRIHFGYRVCFARNADSEELHQLTLFLRQLRQDFATTPAEAAAISGTEITDTACATEAKKAAEAAVWTVVARTMLNLDEFIVRE